MRQGGLGQMDNTHYQTIKSILEVATITLKKITRLTAMHIGNDNIRGPKLLSGLGNSLLHTFSLRQIRRYTAGLPTSGADTLDRLFNGIPSPSSHHHLTPFRREQLAAGPADPLTATGDKYHLVLNTQIHA